MSSLQTIQDFWQANPVAAKEAGIPIGTPDYFKKVDALREAPDCEPWAYANRIHRFADFKGRSVLDVGCGHGYVLSHYAKQGAQVTGVDLTERAVLLSRERFRLSNLPGQFTKINGSQLPFPDQSFDLVCSMGVLHHMPDPSPLVSEIARVLKPSGRFIGMLYHRGSFRNHVTFRWRKWFGNNQYRGKPIEQQRNMNDGAQCPYATVYSPEEAEALLDPYFQKPVFEINKLSYPELFLYSRIGGRLSHWLPSPSKSWIARRWGWNLYFETVKQSSHA